MKGLLFPIFFAFVVAAHFGLSHSANPTITVEDELGEIPAEANGEFIGRYENKTFFLFPAEESQYSARSRCYQDGFKLAEFDSREEFHFVHNRTSLKNCWTDAVLSYAPTSFRWNADEFEDHIAEDLYINRGGLETMGLRMGTIQNAPSLIPQSSATENCYICYQNVL